MASPITGDVAVSGGVDYSFNSDGSASFFAAASGPSAQAASAFNAQSSGSILTSANDFLYNGNITPAVFTTVVNGQSGTLTLNSLSSEIYTADGPEVFLTGTFDQAGYAEEFASVSLLLQGEYIGNNINFLMFKGIAQLSPPVTPEPASIALLGTGLLGLAGLAWRRKHTLAAAR